MLDFCARGTGVKPAIELIDASQGRRRLRAPFERSDVRYRFVHRRRPRSG